MNENDLLQERQKTVRTRVHCEFQRPCWKNIRAPKARKHHIYLPYICSYQEEGDLDKCGLRDTFIEEKEKGVSVVDGAV